MTSHRALSLLLLVTACHGCPPPPTRVCTPGAVVACYDGPAGTAGGGACAAGERACAADGLSWGDCAGDVTPVAEDCAAPADEDCDGRVDEADEGCLCAPGAADACYDGPVGTEGVGVCVGGAHTCDLDGLGWVEAGCPGEVVPTPEDCATPEDEDCDGATPACPATPACARSFVGARPVAVAAGADGAIVVAGEASGTFDLGTGTFTAARTAAFVVRLDAACAVDWVRVWQSDTGGAAAQSVAIDPDGDVIVGGAFSGGVDFGGGPLHANAPGWGTEDDMFLVKLDPDGGHVFSQRFGDDLGDQYLWGLATDADGNLLLTGNLPGTADFGGGAVQGSGFVAKLDPDGGHLWSRGWRGGRGRGIGVDADGNVYVAGLLESSSDLGGGALVPAGPGAAAYVASFGPDGAPRWSRAAGTGVVFASVDLAVTSADDVLLVGAFTGTIDLGGGPLVAAGDADLFVAALDADGAHGWSRRLGDALAQGPIAVGAAGAADVALAGGFRGTIAPGGSTLTSAGLGDAFAARLDATAAPRWATSFGDAAEQSATDVAGAADGAVVAVGTFAGTIDVGLGPTTATGAHGDGFLVRWAP